MCSRLPKVLHPLGGRSLLSHVIETARKLSPDGITVVYGHGGEQVRQHLDADDLDWCEQEERLGTGHAVMQAQPFLQGVDQVLILYGDVPLIDESTLVSMLERLRKSDLVLLTVNLADPTGYGRIVRDDENRVHAIVEYKDANEFQLEIKEVNTGIMAVSRQRLERWLSQVDNKNSQNEYYLTDIVALAVKDGVEIAVVHPTDKEEVMGVNDRKQLAYLERHLQRKIADGLMEAGVSLADPSRLDVRGRLKTGRDIFIDVNAVFEGEVELADGVTIGPNVWIKDSVIGEQVEILANSVIEDAQIGAGCRIGPFARFRPDVRLADHVRVGNFVEIKKSQVASGSKINHLSYVGDSRIGSKVNIGAGTITCNYDGANKHQTVIGDNAFIGSDTQLVAPVTVGAGATIGAGSTITRDTPADKLTLSRAKQVSVDNWQRPVKQPKDS
jgi:bifunctional UDP-N-acetylglucosamine pyrophosphorylase/glucosamine-1-phosphate N-acetyltransferase